MPRTGWTKSVGAPSGVRGAPSGVGSQDLSIYPKFYHFGLNFGEVFFRDYLVYIDRLFLTYSPRSLGYK